MRSIRSAVTVAMASALALAMAACSSTTGTGAGTSSTSTAAPSSTVSETQSESQQSTEQSGTSEAPTTESTEQKPDYGFSSTVQEACDAAGAEGTVNYGAATDPSVLADEIKPFNAKYPAIKIAYTNVRGTDATQRLLAEDQAGKKASLDLMAGVLSDFAPLFDQKLIMNVDWSKLGVADDLIANEGSGNAWRNYRLTLGIGYNSDRYKPEDLPDTWEGLLDSKWAGDIIVDPRGEYLAPLGIAWGEDKAMDWFKKFLDTDKPIILQGATASAQKIISGEVSLTTSAANANVAESQAAGAPLALKYLDVVGTSDYHTMIPSTAQHPNAAACFAAWLASDEGMAQIEKFEFKQNLTQPTGLAPNAVLASRDTAEEQQAFVNTAQAMSKLMQQ